MQYSFGWRVSVPWDNDNKKWNLYKGNEKKKGHCSNRISANDENLEIWKHFSEIEIQIVQIADFVNFVVQL